MTAPTDDTTTVPPVLAWGGATHTGMVREANEDSFVAESLVFAVADGMGGHAAGEVASAIAASTLRERLREGIHSVELMVAAVVEANAAIFQAAHTRSDQRGMGTTVVALSALVDADGRPSQLVLANVGDSRAYRLRAGGLRRLSVDHSYVQELVNTGHISEMEARTHPRRNIVTRALGIEPTVRVDTWLLPMAKGDRYLLCSDGLVDEIDDTAITLLLAEHASPQGASEALVTAANLSGGHDNVTVVVIDVLDGDEAVDDDDGTEWAPTPRERLIDAEAVRGNPAITVDPVAEPNQLRWWQRGPGLSRGSLLFLLTIVLLAAATAALVFLVGGEGDPPVVTTTLDTMVTTSSTVPSSTTSSTTSSVVASTSTTLLGG